MGRNARDRARRRQGVLTASTLVEHDLSVGLNRLFRKRCSACGHGVLRWLGLGDAIDTFGLEWVNELLAETGWPGDQLEVWHCTRCGERGAFGPAEVL